MSTGGSSSSGDKQPDKHDEWAGEAQKLIGEGKRKRKTEAQRLLEAAGSSADAPRTKRESKKPDLTAPATRAQEARAVMRRAVAPLQNYGDSLKASKLSKAEIARPWDESEDAPPKGLSVAEYKELRRLQAAVDGIEDYGDGTQDTVAVIELGDDGGLGLAVDAVVVAVQSKAASRAYRRAYGKDVARSDERTRGPVPGPTADQLRARCERRLGEVGSRLEEIDRGIAEDPKAEANEDDEALENGLRAVQSRLQAVAAELSLASADLRALATSLDQLDALGEYLTAISRGDPDDDPSLAQDEEDVEARLDAFDSRPEDADADPPVTRSRAGVARPAGAAAATPAFEADPASALDGVAKPHWTAALDAEEGKKRRRVSEKDPEDSDDDANEPLRKKEKATYVESTGAPERKLHGEMRIVYSFLRMWLTGAWRLYRRRLSAGAPSSDDYDPDATTTTTTSSSVASSSSSSSSGPSTSDSSGVSSSASSSTASNSAGGDDDVSDGDVADMEVADDAADLEALNAAMVYREYLEEMLAGALVAAKGKGCCRCCAAVLDKLGAKFCYIEDSHYEFQWEDPFAKAGLRNPFTFEVSAAAAVAKRSAKGGRKKTAKKSSKRSSKSSKGSSLNP